MIKKIYYKIFNYISYIDIFLQWGIELLLLIKLLFK